ncbi:MAG: DUF4373 domain-containing protein [Desulfobacterales bacterium]
MKDAYYFPHFSNARHDRKLKRIIKELGIEGYGIYFMLLEVLRDQPELKYPINDVDLLADEFRTSEAKVKTVIMNYNLFDIDEQNNFFSIKLEEYLQPYFRMRQQRISAGKKSAEKRKLKEKNEHPFSDRSATVQQSKVKESKVKESKVKENKEKESIEKESRKKTLFKNSPANDFEYFKKKLSTEEFRGEDLQKYYNQIKDWSLSNNEMKSDWIATARNWIRRDRQRYNNEEHRYTPPKNLIDWKK